MESWSVFWSGMKSNLDIVVALLGQDLYFIPFDSFAMCRSHALNKL